MYNWYGGALLCIAYIADVPSASGTGDQQEMWHLFKKSAWFTRGWTLQELLAPNVVVFCNQPWEILGYKLEGFSSNPWTGYHSLKNKPGVLLRPLKLNNMLCEITGIEREFIVSPKLRDSASIPCKMSWAARRMTTWPEDMAYCLLGIFNVNMPLLYGEGAKAFLRLQEEIVRQSTDQSLFAWWRPPPQRIEFGTSIFAYSPLDFVHSGHMNDRDTPAYMPYAVTNLGLEMRCSVQKVKAVMAQYVHIVPLWQIFILKLPNCVRISEGEPRSEGRDVELAVHYLHSIGPFPTRFRQMRRICQGVMDLEEVFPTSQREDAQEQLVYLKI